MCSAACGADLLALEVARKLNIRREIFLPCDVNRFKQLSVLDRGGVWGALYDAIIQAAIQDNSLTLLDSDSGPPDYIQANLSILNRTMNSLGSKCALIVWDGRSRGHDDVTANFGAAAQSLGLDLQEIRTDT